MDTKEHILTILAEECSEVSKEVCKALRFGLDDKVTRDPSGPRGTEGPTNREKIAQEMIDLLAVYKLAVDEGILPEIGFATNKMSLINLVRAKKAKVRSYMEYARKVGALE